MPRTYTRTSDPEMMNFTFQRGFLAHHNAVLSLSAECVQVDKKILMHIHYIFTKNIVKHRTSDPGAGNCTILEEIMIFIMNYSIFLKVLPKCCGPWGKGS